MTTFKNTLLSLTKLTNAQKAKLLYAFNKLAVAVNSRKSKRRQAHYLAALDSKKHRRNMNTALVSIVENYYRDALESRVIDYVTMLADLKTHIGNVNRQRRVFNKVAKAGINWEMYVKAHENEITNDKGQSIQYPIKCFIWYTDANRDLIALDLAMGAGPFSSIMNKPKLPQAVRKAVKHQRGHLQYVVDSWIDYAGLLEGTATANGCNDAGVDWASFLYYGDQEFKYYPGLDIRA